MDSKTLFEVLKKQAPIFQVQNAISVAKYYNSAADLKQQADTYLDEGDDERAYVFLRRFTNLVLHTIPAHNSANAKQYQKEKQECRRQCAEALTTLEAVHARLQQRYDAPRSLPTGGAGSAVPSAPPGGDDSDDEQAIAAGLRSTALHDPEAKHADAASVASASALPNSSTQPPQGVARQISWDSLRLPEAPASASSPVKPGTGSPASIGTAGYPDIRKQPPPPTGQKPPPSGTVPKSQFRMTAEKLEALRSVTVSAAVLNQFREFAAENTALNIETCGILCGVLKKNKFEITTVVIPKQDATANTCVTHSEEELCEIQDKKGLLTLGWIHTHPTQTCFLSSVDLHTHFSYQIMLNEAIAIVLAPTARPDAGIFSLTPVGLQALGACDHRGFHRHADEQSLYGPATHVVLDMNKKNKLAFIDLRGKPAPGHANHRH